MIFAFLLIGCTTKSSTQEMGYWEDDKPYRGTLEKNKNNANPFWQCVEPFTPYKNKEC